MVTLNMSIEGYCVQQDTFEAICDLLRPEDIWYTMVKGIHIHTMKTFHYILTNRLPLRVSVGTKEMHSTSKIMKRYGPFALYLSVRSIPEDCPFKDAYHFTYNNNTGGFCTNPTSYAKSCASASKFRFHFKHCPDAAYTHDAGINQTLSLIHMLFNCNLILFFGQKVYASIVSPQCCCRHNKKGKVKIIK